MLLVTKGYLQSLIFNILSHDHVAVVDINMSNLCVNYPKPFHTISQSQRQKNFLLSIKATVVKSSFLKTHQIYAVAVCGPPLNPAVSPLGGKSPV